MLEVFGSTPPTAFRLLLLPEGRVDSVTPVIQERWPCQIPDVADSSRLEDHRGTGILWTSGEDLTPAAQIEIHFPTPGTPLQSQTSHQV